MCLNEWIKHWIWLITAFPVNQIKQLLFGKKFLIIFNKQFNAVFGSTHSCIVWSNQYVWMRPKRTGLRQRLLFKHIEYCPRNPFIIQGFDYFVFRYYRTPSDVYEYRLLIAINNSNFSLISNQTYICVYFITIGEWDVSYASTSMAQNFMIYSKN